MGQYFLMLCGYDRQATPKQFTTMTMKSEFRKFVLTVMLDLWGTQDILKRKVCFEFDKGYLSTANNMFDDTIKVEKTGDSIIVYLYYPNQEPVPFKFNR